MTTNHTSTSPEETKQHAAKLAQSMPNGGTVCLYGDLGSGKTVFAKGFAEQLGIKETEVKSPTYTLMREYAVGSKKLYHFDFYRIEEVDELTAHNLEEIFARKNAWFLIEWPERIKNLLPAVRKEVHLRSINENQREVSVKDA